MTWEGCAALYIAAMTIALLDNVLRPSRQTQVSMHQIEQSRVASLCLLLIGFALLAWWASNG